MLCNLSKHNTTYTIQIQTLSRSSLHKLVERNVILHVFRDAGPPVGRDGPEIVNAEGRIHVQVGQLFAVDDLAQLRVNQAGSGQLDGGKGKDRMSISSSNSSPWIFESSPSHVADATN